MGYDIYMKCKIQSLDEIRECLKSDEKYLKVLENALSKTPESYQALLEYDEYFWEMDNPLYMGAIKQNIRRAKEDISDLREAIDNYEYYRTHDEPDRYTNGFTKNECMLMDKHRNEEGWEIPF